MKKILIGIGLFAGSLLTGTLIAYAAPSVSAIFQGGTGTTTAPTSQLIYGGTGPVYQSVATTSAICTGNTTCSGFTVIGSSPVTINSTGGSGSVTSITLNGLDGVSPITTTGTIIAQISTSSVPSVGNIPYWTGAGTPSTLGTVATSSPTFNGGLTTSGTAGYLIGGSGFTVSISAPVSIANGGTNATSFSPSRTLVYYDGTRLVSTSTEPLYVGAIIATSTLTNSGIGTSTPWGTFAINPVAGQAANAFVIGSSTATTFKVNNAGQVSNTAAGFTGVVPNTRAIPLQTGTTTTWTGTTTDPYVPHTPVFFSGTIQSAICDATSTQAFLGTQIFVNNTSLVPSYFVASSTHGTITFTSSNTFVSGDVIRMVNGTTTSDSNAKSITCTLITTQTPS